MSFFRLSFGVGIDDHRRPGGGEARHEFGMWRCWTPALSIPIARSTPERLQKSAGGSVGARREGWSSESTPKWVLREKMVPYGLSSFR